MNTANIVDRKTKLVVIVKVLLDKDSKTQIQGIVNTIYESSVSSIIVGNTTIKRPAAVLVGYILLEKDRQVLLETSGYSSL